MICPKCGERMPTRTIDGARLAECDGCHGVWAAQGQLGALVRTSTDLRAVFPAESVTAFGCPAGCSERLEEVAYSKTESELLLDRCPGCLGIYLDAGELDRVISINERIRQLFGDGTFTGPPPKRSSFGRIFKRIFGN